MAQVQVAHVVVNLNKVKSSQDTQDTKNKEMIIDH
jgi:hypothetical protein